MRGIATGDRLKERYRLERLLGHGGMAAVWLGHDEVLERPVAVKVLSDTIASDPEFVTRFRREARTAAGLSHPNLVGVYDYSEENERPYLVMQFVPGEDLAAKIARQEAVDRDKLARELLAALAHIHAAGILHRDVKPANVIVEPDATAKLIDFGIALPQDATALTRTGLVLGTERYAAPEVMEGQAASERSDLYSAGVVLRACEGQCSPALRSLIEWLASPEPEGRPGSARQALARLERPESDGQTTQAFETVPSTTAPIALAEPVERKGAETARPGSNHLRAAAILALFAAAAVIAVVVLSGGGKGGRTADSPHAQAKQTKGQKQSSEETEAPATEAPAAAPTASGADPTRGSSLNEQGYAMVQAGEYEAAVPVLEEAVRAFPEGTEDLDYAYALFNLGNALRLSGRPEEAIPVLEQRLQIPNQTETVEQELEAARKEADLG
ncbi:MAG TPA: serine/threonine-protein kinase [Solirubrobacterales bacterium]|nr:serine/threonine-protein kinase [Solirubrobacterales bacterium]